MGVWEPPAVLAWAMKKWCDVVGVDLLGEAPAAEDHTAPRCTPGVDSSSMNVVFVLPSWLQNPREFLEVEPQGVDSTVFAVAHRGCPGDNWNQRLISAFLHFHNFILDFLLSISI